MSTHSDLFNVIYIGKSKEIFFCFFNQESPYYLHWRYTENKKWTWKRQVGRKKENQFFIRAHLWLNILLKKHVNWNIGIQCDVWNKSNFKNYPQIDSNGIWVLKNTTSILKVCMHLVAEDDQEILNTLFLIFGSCSLSLSTKYCLRHSNAVYLDLLLQPPASTPGVKFSYVWNVRQFETF